MERLPFWLLLRNPYVLMKDAIDRARIGGHGSAAVLPRRASASDRAARGLGLASLVANEHPEVAA